MCACHISQDCLNITKMLRSMLAIGVDGLVVRHCIKLKLVYFGLLAIMSSLSSALSMPTGVTV